MNSSPTALIGLYANPPYRRAQFFQTIIEFSLEKQYDLAKGFLGEVCRRAKGQLGKMPLCIVPGNHDVDRKQVDDFQMRGRDEQTKATVQEMMNSCNLAWKRTLERQSQWFEFAKVLTGHGIEWNDELLASHSVIEHNGKRIGVAGFNSSWASHGEGESGKLWLGQHQLDAVHEKIADCDFKIAVTHHPLTWLNDEEQFKIQSRVETLFDVYLHGHRHSQWYVDAKSHLVVSAGACYEQAEKTNSYSWITIDFSGKRAEVQFRTYSDGGAGGWTVMPIPGKTDDLGKASITSLFSSDSDAENYLPKNAASQQAQTPSPPVEKPSELSEYITRLDRNHRFRWEHQSLPPTPESPVVYWPVKLRHPTPIHAAQAFAAAGLQLCGCQIQLWIDDLGNTDCDEALLTRNINNWFSKSGGDITDIIKRSFKDVVQSEDKTVAWRMVKKWLSTRRYKAKEVLEISKIVPEKGDSDGVLQGISNRRPRRLMTPAMVWACLLEMHSADEGRPIITLGGFDECRLWEAWHKCVEQKDVQLGHLFVPKLQRQSDTFSMARAGEEFHWTSRQDIQNAFAESLNGNDVTVADGEQHQMVPWCLNNCVALPRFVAGKPAITIGRTTLTKIEHCVGCAADEALDECVEAVVEWLL